MKPDLTTVFTTSHLGEGGSFVLTNLRPENCNDCQPRRDSDFSNVRNAVNGSLQATIGADLETVKSQIRALNDVVEVTGPWDVAGVDFPMPHTYIKWLFSKRRFAGLSQAAHMIREAGGRACLLCSHFGMMHEGNRGEMPMALTAQEVFTETVRALSPSERLRLAALILQDLAQAEVAVVDRSDTWNEQDQHDLTTFTLQYATELYPEDEELV